MPGTAFAHGVPAGLVLPVVVTAAEHEPWLGPDDLGADVEVAAGKTGCDFARMQRTVPNVRHRARKEGSGRATVRTVIVGDAFGPGAVVNAGALSPRRIVGNAIRRVGDHQLGPEVGQEP